MTRYMFKTSQNRCNCLDSV